MGAIIASFIHFALGALYGYSGITITQLVDHQTSIDFNYTLTGNNSQHLEDLIDYKINGGNDAYMKPDTHDITLTESEVSYFGKSFIILFFNHKF